MRMREHGPDPKTVVALHGGPGAAGDVDSLAQELARRGYGVLEPFQTEASVEGQIEELRRTIIEKCDTPIILIGCSWGAWLACLVAARHPALIAQLVLVGSGPFDAHHARGIMQTRLSRLSDIERAEYRLLIDQLDRSADTSRLMQLFDKTDGYCVVDAPHPSIEFDPAIYRAVWCEAATLRRSGRLLEIVATIDCPVTAIHGDYDPHPAEGVRRPLQACLSDFDFILLERCGHRPWQEAHARSAFFEKLQELIGGANAATWRG
ncbi:MAG: alpha/beta fold hydrolase [Hyphomicrobiaceae bacterium]